MTIHKAPEHPFKTTKAIFSKVIFDEKHKFESIQIKYYWLVIMNLSSG